MRQGEASRRGQRQTNASSEREALFRAYYAPLFAFVRSQVDSVEKAKRIAAAAFETISEVPETAPPLEPRVLLFTRARLAIETEQRVAKAPPRSAGPAGGKEPLTGCIKRLPRRQQAVLALRFDGALPCSEIALVMGLSEVEVMVLVLRALRRIKACLDAAGRETDAGTRGSLSSAP